jgi:hypothetical protein
MRRYLLISLATMAAFVAWATVAAGVADAMMLSDQGQPYGVVLAPGTDVSSLSGVNVIASDIQSPTQCDPWLSPDLVTPALPLYGLCWHGGPSSDQYGVLHGNETFALTWDPLRRYYSSTRGYMEQFLRDVADGSNTLSSPYAVTTQYRDAAGPAANSSLYGGGCIDYGSQPGDFTCQFLHAVVSATGQNYPGQTNLATGCSSAAAQPDCVLTDADVQGEVTSMITQMGLDGRVQPGYSPLLVVLLPSDVHVCLDSNNTLCSAGTGSAGEFCSYHASVRIGTTNYAYVVQPWTASTSCDPQNSSQGSSGGSIQGTDPGASMVSSLSQAQISAITNPWLDGWYANNGAEIADNGCGAVGDTASKVTVGTGSYALAPEFSNAGVLEFDPGGVPQCALKVWLSPGFVVPTPIDSGELVAFDGSVTASSLVVADSYPWTSSAGYSWNFGDGTTATGPSVVHSFAQAGYYKVTLTVTDRGGNVRSTTQTVEVLGPDGQPPSGGTGGGGAQLSVHLQLMPQSVSAVLHDGLAVRVSSNQPANGFATLSIFRSAAHRAHLASGGNPDSLVVIGRGTVSGIKDGSVSMRVRVSSATARKLAHAGHLTLRLRMVLYARSGVRTTATAVGRY